MSTSAVRSSARVIRLADLEPLYPVPAAPCLDHFEIMPGQDAARPTWPDPIGSTRAAMRPGPQVKVVPAATPLGELPRLPRGVVVKLPVRFSARGDEYARLWLANLFWCVLTLGLYLPWARVRSQRYFWRRTQVDGAAMDYHLPPTSLLPRYGLCLGLLVGVVGAWAGSRLAGMLALSMALAVWPLVIYMSLVQRVAHISWARRRLVFDGPRPGLYEALWVPLAGGGLAAWLLMAALAWRKPAAWVAWGAVAILWSLAVPAFVWAYVGFRQRHLQLGPLRLQWKGQRPSVVRMWARTVAWGALVCVLFVGLGVVAMSSVLLAKMHLSPGLTLALVAGLIALAAAAVLPYAQARLQNLIWGKTGNRYLRLRSRLSVRGYVRLQLRHAFLMVITLGFYWPWAVVASRRMRTEALSVLARVDTEVLKARWPAFSAGADEALPSWAPHGPSEPGTGGGGTGEYVGSSGFQSASWASSDVDPVVSRIRAGKMAG